MNEREQQKEYQTVGYLVSALANICAASPNMIIDKLTGFLWDEEEASQIKTANTRKEDLDRCGQKSKINFQAKEVI